MFKKINIFKKNNYEREIFLDYTNFVDSSDVLLIIHIYYAEYIDDISNYLKNLKCDYDIYISICDLSKYRTVHQKFSALGKNIRINIHPNRGRDVGPFVSLINSGFLKSYKYVCKIHEKGSKYSKYGGQWRNDILTELLGSWGRIEKILAALENDEKIGLVGPSGHHLSSNRYWGDNRSSVTKFCKKLKLPKEKITLDFFAGTMFWFKPNAFVNFKKLNVHINDFEEESGQRDGTLAHSLERIFNHLVYSAGYYCSETEKPNVKKIEMDDSNNRVSVLD